MICIRSRFKAQIGLGCGKMWLKMAETLTCIKRVAPSANCINNSTMKYIALIMTCTSLANAQQILDQQINPELPPVCKPLVNSIYEACTGIAFSSNNVPLNVTSNIKTFCAPTCQSAIATIPTFATNHPICTIFSLFAGEITYGPSDWLIGLNYNTNLFCSSTSKVPNCYVQEIFPGLAINGYNFNDASTQYAGIKKMFADPKYACSTCAYQFLELLGATPQFPRISASAVNFYSGLNATQRSVCPNGAVDALATNATNPRSSFFWQIICVVAVLLFIV